MILHPNFLRDSAERFFAFDGTEIAWFADSGDVVFIRDTGSKWERLLELSADQLAAMTVKALRTSGFELNAEERALAHACRTFLAMRDAMEEH